MFYHFFKVNIFQRVNLPSYYYYCLTDQLARRPGRRAYSTPDDRCTACGKCVKHGTYSSIIYMYKSSRRSGPDVTYVCGFCTRTFSTDQEATLPAEQDAWQAGSACTTHEFLNYKMIDSQRSLGEPLAYELRSSASFRTD